MLLPGTVVWCEQIQRYATIGEDKLEPGTPGSANIKEVHYRLQEHGCFASENELEVIYHGSYPIVIKRRTLEEALAAGRGLLEGL